MKVRRQLDTERRIVKLSFELPLDGDPHLTADRVWELTTKQLEALQKRDRRNAGTVPAGMSG